MIKKIHHIDIIITHSCNMKCPNCIDKFVNLSTNVISPSTVETFLSKLREKGLKGKVPVLLLGGEPFSTPTSTIQHVTSIIREYNFSPIVSTNGKQKEKIIQCMDMFDSIQVTLHSQKEIDFYSKYSKKINAKLSGDNHLTIDKLESFIRDTKDFYRQSLSMYFTDNHEEICKDEDVWQLLNALEWTRLGSYLYTFYKGMRIKRSIPNETNIINEPQIPKLYPNENYNQTWNNEDMDDYLHLF